jgi:hypothetical protein
MLALMIASFIGEKMRREIHVRCAAHLDTRVGRKLLERWYGTFRSLLVYSDISQTLRKQSLCASTRKERSQKMMTMMIRRT